MNLMVKTVSLTGASFILSFSGAVPAQETPAQETPAQAAPAVTMDDQRTEEGRKYYRASTFSALASFVKDIGMPRGQDAILCLFAGTANGKEIKTATFAPYKVSAFAFRVDTQGQPDKD